MVQSERHCAGRVSFEQRYYITSLGDAKSFQRAVRSHWGIENGLHWRLDVTFREDESRIRRGNAPHNIGVIRHVAMNLLKREKTKISYRKKRIRAALNDAFRHNLLRDNEFICGCPGPEGLIRAGPPSPRRNAPTLNFVRIRYDDTSTAIVDPGQPEQSPENSRRFTTGCSCNRASMQ